MKRVSVATLDGRLDIIDIGFVNITRSQVSVVYVYVCMHVAYMCMCVCVWVWVGVWATVDAACKQGLSELNE